MSTKTVSTINCPRCQQTIPAWADRCQFCGGTITKGYARPIDAYQYKINNRPSWKEVAYIIVAIIIALQGVYNLLLAADVIPNAFYKLGGSAFVGIIGLIHLALGVGMLTHQSWAQFIVKLGCWLSLAYSSLWLLMQLMMVSRTHHYGLLFATMFNVGLYSLTLYLIGEESDA